jgi:hypothetical protein
MNYKILVLLIMAFFWLNIPEYRLIIGLSYLFLIAYETFSTREKIEIRVLWVLVLLQLIPFMDSRVKISEYILILCITTFLVANRQKISVKTILMIGVISVFSNIAFNVLYSYAGKVLSIAQFMGFDNSGHLGILMAINSQGRYLDFLNSGKAEIGLQFWQYYPQGVMGSIESILRILGLEYIDSNKFSIYIIFLLFNVAMYIIFVYLAYQLLKNNRTNMVLNIIVIFILSITSVFSIFLINGFANYMYSLVVILIYIQISYQQKSFVNKCLILFTMVLSTPFILPIFVMTEIITYLMGKKNYVARTNVKKIVEIMFYLFVFSLYLIYYLDKWGYDYLSVPGGITPINNKYFILFIIFWIVLIWNRFISKSEINCFEVITVTSQLAFLLLSLVVITQSQTVSYYAIKQGYIAIILTIIYIVKEVSNLKFNSNSQTLIAKSFSLFLIIIITFSDVNVIERIGFFNRNEIGSPRIAVNGSKIINSIAIARKMNESEFIYVGLYDSDLSSRLLNGGVLKWDDYSSGLFYGLAANADSITIQDKIDSLSKWLVLIKQGNTLREVNKLVIFYETNTNISAETNNKLSNFEFILIE